MKVSQPMTSYPVTCVPETHLAHGIRDLRPSSITVADAVSGSVMMCGPDGEAQTVLATLDPGTETASPALDAA
jgi:hypothetical protein